MSKDSYCGRCRNGSPPGTYGGDFVVVCDHSWFYRIVEGISNFFYELECRVNSRD